MLTGRRLWPSQDLGLDVLVVEQATRANAQAVSVSVRNTRWSPEGRREMSSARMAVAAAGGAHRAALTTPEPRGESSSAAIPELPRT